MKMQASEKKGVHTKWKAIKQ